MPDLYAEYLRSKKKRPDFSDVKGGSSSRAEKSSGEDDSLYSEYLREKQGTSRGVKAGVEQVVNGVKSWDAIKSTVKGMATAVRDDFTNAKAPAVGSYRGNKIAADGMPIYDGKEGEKITRENTPNAVTLREKMKGALNTSANIGFAAAPQFRLPARAAINAGMGAIQDDEDRIRGATAGLLFGEAALGAGRVVGKTAKATGRAIARKADVFDGALESGVKDLELSVNDQRTITHASPRRVVQRPPPPVEPPPGARAVSVARPEAGRRSATGQRDPNELAITETAEAPSVATAANDFESLDRAWPRRPALDNSAEIPTVSIQQVAAMLAPDTEPDIVRAITESANANAAQRTVPRNEPDGTGSPPTLPPPDPIPDAIAETRPLNDGDVSTSEPVSWPPEPEIAPVVSSNGEFSARPGVMRKVNAAEPALAGAGRLPEPTAADQASYRPEGVLRISPEDVSARKTAQSPEPPEKQGIQDWIEGQDKAEAGTNARDKDGKFHEARMPSGGLRDFRTITNDGLIKESQRFQRQLQEAQERAQYLQVEESDSYHGASRAIATGRDEGGVSKQAKAQQTIRDMTRLIQEVDNELNQRGLSSDDIYTRQEQLDEFEAAREREIERAGMEADEMDDSFDFGDDTPTARPGTPRPHPHTQPREYLNLARTGLDKTAEARVREIVEAGRAKGTIDKGYRSFDEADVGAMKEKRDLTKKLVDDPLLLDLNKLRNVSTDEIKAMWMVVGDNTKTLEAAARVMNDPSATSVQRLEAADLYEAANKQTEQLVSSIVTETAQKGRELGGLRNIAKQSTDAEVWLVQAKRLSPDKPLPDGVMANIRKLAREASEACNGA